MGVNCAEFVDIVEAWRKQSSMSLRDFFNKPSFTRKEANVSVEEISEPSEKRQGEIQDDPWNFKGRICIFFDDMNDNK